jgi:hypothetical protein
VHNVEAAAQIGAEIIASLRLQDLQTFLTRSAWIWLCWKARFDIWFPPGRTSHASQVNIEQ